MASDAVASGLDAAAVVATRPYYKIDASSPSPLPYSAFTPPLTPEDAVRLLVFFVEGEGAPVLHTACDAATAALKGALPPGASVHVSRRDGRHMTLFQTSHPQCLCPDATNPEARGPAPPPGAPPPGAVAREVDAARALAAAAAPPTLTAHSIVLAKSGTLLLLLTEEGGAGRVAALRAAAAAAFPGTAVRQPAIMHVTLARVLSPLTPAETGAVAAAVAGAAGGVAGARFVPGCVSHVCEATFATVAGARVDLAWRGGEPRNMDVTCP
jgi:hypothetical protein